METQGLTSRLHGANESTFGDAGRRLTLSGLAVGVAIGAWSGWALERAVATASPTMPVATVTTPATIDAAGQPAVPQTGASRSLSVSMPADDAYLTTASIPVAGDAFGRPHGPKVASVHVELIAQGRSVSSVDIPVFSGRFAGVLLVPSLADRTTGQLRISDPLHNGPAAVVRTVTIDQR